MPRPTSKDELLSQARKEREALKKQLMPLSAEHMTQPGIVGEWSVKDVLAHLTEWEQIAIGWYEAGLRGENPELPAPGFKWNQTPALNQHIYEKHCGKPLADVQSDFDRSYSEIVTLIEQVSEEDLFTPSIFTGHARTTWRPTSSRRQAVTIVGHEPKSARASGV